jgi:hypothetical protein
VTGDRLLRRSVCAAGQLACSQVSRCIGLPGSDREFPALTGRSGTQRARACFGEHLIRRCRHIVQDRPSRAVHWADVPQLSVRVKCCLAAWQQFRQQSRRNGADPRPSANEWRIPSRRAGGERPAVSPVADARRWPLLLLSPLLSTGARGMETRT